MPNWNLALIDVATAWVVVALPRYAQARLLVRSGCYSAEAIYALGIEERATIDPVKHTSILGTLLAPVLTSVASMPVLAWGKPIESGNPGRRQPKLAACIWMAPTAVYALQAFLLAALMAALAHIYLPGAPVAARAGQLCLRLALLNLVPLPVLDSGLSVSVFRGQSDSGHWLPATLSVTVLAALAATGILRAMDNLALYAFFIVSRLFV